MEQMPHHREGIQNDLDKAYDEGQRDNELFTNQKLEEERQSHLSANEKAMVAEKEKAPVGFEEIKARFSSFFTRWFYEKVEQKPSIVAPENIDWQALKNDIDKSKFGEYTVNPDTVSIDWGLVPIEKIKSISLEEMGTMKDRAEAAEYILSKYGATHHIPGVEYWEYLIQNYRHAPFEDPTKEQREIYNFFGSIIRSDQGYTDVPSMDWNHGRLEPFIRRIDNVWDSRTDRAILVEK